MSETKKVTVPADTIRKLRSLSTKFQKLNTGAVGDNFWIASSQGDSDYEWGQFDIGINKQKELITCEQGGCSCNGPEEPTADDKQPLTGSIEFEEGYYGEVKEAVDELIETTDILYKILNGKNVDPKEAISLPNAELRRAVLELIGYDKLISGAEVLDESDIDGKLLCIKLQGDEDLMLLHVKDASTDREYFLRVPPKMKTARQARAWTFGFEPEDFVLEAES